MKDEIKEILDYLRKFAENENPKKENNVIIPIKLGYVDTNLLLDYITDLQQELNDITTYIDTRMNSIKNTYKKAKDINRKEILYNRYCELRNIKGLMDGVWEGEKIIDKGEER